MREFGTATRSSRDPNKPDLLIPIGIPASGKSTWADKQHSPIICPDTYRRQVYGGAPANGLIPDQWPDSRSRERDLALGLLTAQSGATGARSNYL